MVDQSRKKDGLFEELWKSKDPLKDLIQAREMLVTENSKASAEGIANTVKQNLIWAYGDNYAQYLMQRENYCVGSGFNQNGELHGATEDICGALRNVAILADAAVPYLDTTVRSSHERKINFLTNYHWRRGNPDLYPFLYEIQVPYLGMLTPEGESEWYMYEGLTKVDGRVLESSYTSYENASKKMIQDGKGQPSFAYGCQALFGVPVDMSGVMVRPINERLYYPPSVLRSNALRVLLGEDKHNPEEKSDGTTKTPLKNLLVYSPRFVGDLTNFFC